MATNILLIDLSSIGHAMWHVCANEPDPNAASTKTVERVRALASGQPHVAICMDAPPYFRTDISADYKAKRDKDNNALVSHQLAVAAATLKADGFPVWAVKGFEADDVIATAVAKSTSFGGHGEVPDQNFYSVTIASADKDLWQLVSDRVKVHNVAPSAKVIDIDEEAVKARFGVAPHQMVDYLSLVGDKSDNVVGAAGIGEVKAAKLLQAFGNLDDMYRALDETPSKFANGTITSLREFQPRLATVRELITLRTDVPLPFDEVFRERVPQDVAVFGGMMDSTADKNAVVGFQGSNAIFRYPPKDEHERESLLQAAAPAGASAPADRPGSEPAPAAVVREDRAADIQRDRPDAPRAQQGEGRPTLKDTDPAVMLLRQQQTQQAAERQLVREPDIISAAPVEWERQLEPRSYEQAKQMAADLFAARLFSGYGNAPAVLSTIIIGRQLGLEAGASLRGFSIIDGKHSMTADLIRSRVLSSPLCEYFRIVERSAEKATWVTKRKGDPEVSLTYTIEQGRQAWQKDQKAWDASAWGKRPANMVTKTASSELARLIYPDVVGGFYCPEELSGEER